MNDDVETTRRPSRLSTILAALILLSIFVLPAAGFWWLRSTSHNVVESYRLAHARDMLIRHLVRTGGQWPRSWEDLAEDFEPTNSNYRTPGLDVIQEHVEVDFDADVSVLLEKAANPHASIRVIRLKGQAASPAVDEANDLLLEYLRARAGIGNHREIDKPAPNP